MNLIDRFGRPLKSLRISVTKACDYRCIYCHREGLKRDVNDELTPSELYKLAKASTELGIYRVKITGGEPLLREDLPLIISKLKEAGMKEVSLTTNGHMLPDKALELRKAGLDRVNVSLPSLRDDVYRFVTGMDVLPRVLKGIKVSYELGMRPIKLNYVYMKGINEGELQTMMNFVAGKDMILQVIELEPSNLAFYQKHHAKLDDVERFLKERAVEVKRRELHNRLQYLLPDDIKVEVVRPVHNTNFCMGCNRIRVTPDGKLKPCLFRNDNLVDFVTLLRNGADEEEMKRQLTKANELREPFFKRG
jgi:cyclic pyranopterin phosphate synthase